VKKKKRKEKKEKSPCLGVFEKKKNQKENPFRSR